MIIGSSQKLRKIYTPMAQIPHFRVNGNDIDLVKETKYLGLLIDDNLKWESNVKYTQKKISRAIGVLKYAKHYIQEGTLRNIYLSIVQPHFSYCCSVWGCCGTTKLNTLQKLQNRAARIVTGSPFDTPAAPLLQWLGWPSIEKLINQGNCTMVYKSLKDLAPENQGSMQYQMLSCCTKNENSLWPKIICISRSQRIEYTRLGSEVSPFDSVIQNETKSIIIQGKLVCICIRKTFIFYFHFTCFCSFLIIVSLVRIALFLFCRDNWKAVDILNWIVYSYSYSYSRPVAKGGLGGKPPWTFWELTMCLP